MSVRSRGGSGRGSGRSRWLWLLCSKGACGNSGGSFFLEAALAPVDLCYGGGNSGGTGSWLGGGGGGGGGSNNNSNIVGCSVVARQGVCSSNSGALAEAMAVSLASCSGSSSDIGSSVSCALSAAATLCSGGEDGSVRRRQRFLCSGGLAPDSFCALAALAPCSGALEAASVPELPKRRWLQRFLCCSGGWGGDGGLSPNVPLL
ncbi:Hypothetical predicted protein [Marmota monax]|uniref:Uncharacterized protein n=1 Tax=Marmota monax TaxID=9995 RepID=A0A5E4D136_MARMO|nr:hypothetical protein GHT09_016949 [Marmota monax]VTJ87854.1 Hypothetical predicted protein [Marmota monax]